ncbi:rod shape-determining protein MreD [Massiliimalia massiliensis]|uniref:rod shape-determining protein MreD n=1 Tax=Massiliimalia massiliensis TaxID=1852384 RepID=UPI000986137C|nr:rod shape-determining protein MreD [Massiliimalia massiliensis]MBS1473418.1 rod shape-determining protein MreD [Massiliimalia sp.]
MIFERKKPKVRYFAYAILLLLCFLLQVTPGVLELWGVKPILVVPAAVCIAMEEPVLPASVFGMAAGLLWDFTAGTVFGYHALLWLLFCAAVSLSVTFYLSRHWFNRFLLCFGALLLDGVIKTAFSALIWQEPGTWSFWMSQLLPAAGYTVFWCFPIGSLIRRISVFFHRSGGLDTQ